ncbi:hypothetical protein ACQEUU_29770 [Nonomuraea sp. CA-218870]
MKPLIALDGLLSDATSKRIPGIDSRLCPLHVPDVGGGGRFCD